MTFHSILFERTEDGIKDEALDAPVFLADLNLDQVIGAITAGRDEYNLKPFFYISLNYIDAIKYRHEIMQDLENATLSNTQSRLRKKCAQCANILPKQASFTTSIRRKRGSWTQ
jgi:hypothetical protein